MKKKKVELRKGQININDQEWRMKIEHTLLNQIFLSISSFSVRTYSNVWWHCIHAYKDYSFFSSCNRSKIGHVYCKAHCSFWEHHSQCNDVLLRVDVGLSLNPLEIRAHRLLQCNLVRWCKISSTDKLHWRILLPLLRSRGRR